MQNHQQKGLCCLGLVNPKSPENVGIVLRAAGCYGANTVFYSGRRYDIAKEFVTDTHKAHQHIPLIQTDDFKASKPLGVKVVAVEFIESAIPLPSYRHPDQAFYIFGPEDGSISKDILKWADDVVYIPTIACMNLAATVNVLLYDRQCKRRD